MNEKIDKNKLAKNNKGEIQRAINILDKYYSNYAYKLSKLI